MRLEQYIRNAREIFENEFNLFLDAINAEHQHEENWIDLEHIQAFVKSEFLLQNNERSLAIYPCSPNGTTYSESDNGIESGFTISFYLNKDSSTESEEETLAYYAASILFAKTRQFSEYDIIDDSILLQTSMGYEYNGFAMFIKSRLATSIDADYMKELIYGN